jgi:hypothetical protein
VDTARDLARVDAWQESLERSRTRRQRPVGYPREPRRPRMRRTRAPDARPARELPSYWRLCLQAVARRRVMVVVAVALVAAALLAATRADAPVRLRTWTAATARRTDPARAVAGSQPMDSCRVAATVGAIVGRETDTPKPGGALTGYVNPLARATVTSERIDQGVDYAGTGTLGAIGSARVTYIGMSDTGWPGVFIEYRLLEGPEEGCYVYYAEGVAPAAGLHVGQALRAGQAVATIIAYYATGIELGWGTGRATETYAAKLGEWNTTRDEDSIPTAAGESFSALIASLGGRPGKIEG